MKHLKTYESKLKEFSHDELNKVLITSPFLEENKTDNNYYKVTEKANGWYYKIKYYYRVPGYINYCFLTYEIDDPYWRMSRMWIKEDKLIKITKEETEEHLSKLDAKKYNI
jgi:hypothetical protein